jgi:hypothetical protein
MNNILLYAYGGYLHHLESLFKRCCAAARAVITDIIIQRLITCIMSQWQRPSGGTFAASSLNPATLWG